VDRREFLGTVTLSLLVAPLAAEAQQPGRVPRIGVLGTSDGAGWQAFRDGLQSLGYLEGRTIAVEWRFAGADAGRFPDLAADLVRQQVDLIVTGTDPAPAAARDATRTIPIVFSGAGDPVASGLVTSLARPGGNLTGLTWDISPDVAAKSLELLKDTKPGLSSVAVLWNRDTGHWVQHYLSVLRSTATTLRLALHPIEVRRPEEIAPAFAELTRRAVQAVYVMFDQVSRRPHVLHAVANRHEPARRHLCGQDLEGCQARRPPRRATQ
jgi:putative tryptophan/tyrosine transport system substrate-binding protein